MIAPEVQHINENILFIGLNSRRFEFSRKKFFHKKKTKEKWTKISFLKILLE
jgi:hypothetical protein